MSLKLILKIWKKKQINIDDYVLNEMVSCLLDNAFEATYEGGHVVLSIYFIENNFIIEVKNEHQKLGLNHFKKIFNKGFSTKELKNTDNTRGYGLYNLLLNIEDNNGKISVYNEEKNGINYVSFRLIF